ncbi:MAG TPA: hypothetical protein VF587_20290 [Solirubrobacteraceae bacterium]|jgi:hypothetical protein
MTDAERIDDESDGLKPTRLWLVHAVAVVVAVVAFAADPREKGSRAAALDDFFPTAASIALTLLVAIALLQGVLGDVVAHSVRRWVDRSVFVHLGVAAVAAAVGTIGGMDEAAYRWLFALAAGPGAAALATVLLMGQANIGAQKERAAAAAARGQSSGENLPSLPKRSASDE